MGLLTTGDWEGRIYDGSWHPAAGGTVDIVEPATGERLTTAGVANSEDMAAAVRGAVVAQRRWAVAAGARLTTGGCYDGLFYRPTVLADTAPGIPCYDNEVFGPVASVASFDSVDKAVDLAADSSFGLSLGILTADVAHGLELAERIPTGIAHINDQPINDAANAPMGGMFDSGTAATRFGGSAANIEAYTTTRWITAHTKIPDYAM